MQAKHEKNKAKPWKNHRKCKENNPNFALMRFHIITMTFDK